MTRGRSVIVTGGASGLGKIMSGYFASRGDTVTILDVNVGDGVAVAAELGAAGGGGEVRFEKCDVASWTEQMAAFKAVYEHAGGVDVVVANAGIAEGGRSWVVPALMMGKGEEEEGEAWDELEEPRLKVLDVNLTGVVYCMCSLFLFSLSLSLYVFRLFPSCTFPTRRVKKHRERRVLGIITSGNLSG